MSSFKGQGGDNDDLPNKKKLKRQYMRSLTEEPSADIIVERYLCDDVLTNILVWLPAKQLARLRCVSKHFNDLLSQPYFISSHLQHHRLNQNTNDEILLVFFEDRFTVHPSSFPNIQLPNFVKLPTNFPSKYSLIGSVNGLICFSSGSSYTVIYIWNPSLSALMTLPPYPTKISRVNFRFGFDPKTNDYKVVLYTLEFRLPNIIEPSIFPNCLQVEVYSLRKGSWVLVTQRFPLHVTLNYAEDQDCNDGENGHIHWLCYYDNMLWHHVRN
ncbi:F-box/kelch-repeat protein-like protein [Tanacetum coccineum]